MKRKLVSYLGFLFIISGIIIGLFSSWGLVSLIIVFFGLFMRLIYNSEKYKFYKFLHLQILRKIGPTIYQKRCMKSCLIGFYLAIVDLLGVVILPFLIIPGLNWPWYIDFILALICLFFLKPIFSPLDEIDKKIATHATEEYERTINDLIL